MTSGVVPTSHQPLYPDNHPGMRGVHTAPVAPFEASITPDLYPNTKTKLALANFGTITRFSSCISKEVRRKYWY